MNVICPGLGSLAEEPEDGNQAPQYLGPTSSIHDFDLLNASWLAGGG